MADGDAASRSVVIGVGASEGGVEALSALMRDLPADLPAAVLVVLHVSPAGTSVLAQILDRAGPLPAVTAADGDELRAGVIYVAPPDRHLLVENGVVRLSVGPRENGHRPAIDPLLRSIAVHDGLRVGVILSGTRDDGTEGLLRLKVAGGTALVQDPDEALYDAMIRSAMEHVAVDAVLPVAELARTLSTLSRSEAMPPQLSGAGDPVPDTPDPTDSATRYTCPECGGALWRDDDRVLRFRCSVGHAYSSASLDDEQGRNVEYALWAATRLLGDRDELLREMAARAERNGHTKSAAAFRARAAEARDAAEVLGSLISSGQIPTTGGTEAA